MVAGVFAFTAPLRATADGSDGLDAPVGQLGLHVVVPASTARAAASAWVEPLGVMMCHDCRSRIRLSRRHDMTKSLGGEEQDDLSEAAIRASLIPMIEIVQTVRHDLRGLLDTAQMQLIKLRPQLGHADLRGANELESTLIAIAESVDRLRVLAAPTDTSPTPRRSSLRVAERCSLP